MMTGRVNPLATLETFGISGLRAVHYNDVEPALVSAALVRGEGVLGQGGVVFGASLTVAGAVPLDRTGAFFDNPLNLSGIVTHAHPRCPAIRHAGQARYGKHGMNQRQSVSFPGKCRQLETIVRRRSERQRLDEHFWIGAGFTLRLRPYS